MASAEQLKLVAEIIDSKGDLAKLLGIDESSSFVEIKKRYRKLAVLVHPDKNPAENAKRAFQVLQTTFDQAEAYLRLRDQQARVDATASVHTSEKRSQPGAKPAGYQQPPSSTQRPASAAPPRQAEGAAPAARQQAPGAFFFSCPKCGQRLRTFMEYVGMTFNCLGCGHQFNVQKPTGDSEARKPAPKPKGGRAQAADDSFSSSSGDDESFSSESSAFDSGDDLKTAPAPPPAAPPPTAESMQSEAQRAQPQHKPASSTEADNAAQQQQQQRAARKKAGPWNCPKCTALCLSKKLKCPSCGAKRPNAEAFRKPKPKGEEHHHHHKKSSHSRAPNNKHPAGTATKPATPSPSQEANRPPSTSAVHVFEVGQKVEVRRRDGRWVMGTVKEVDVAQQYYTVEGMEEGEPWEKKASFAGVRAVTERFYAGDRLEIARNQGWMPCRVRDVDEAGEFYVVQGFNSNGIPWTKPVSFTGARVCLRQQEAAPQEGASAKKPPRDQPPPTTTPPPATEPVRGDAPPAPPAAPAHAAEDGSPRQPKKPAAGPWTCPSCALPNVARSLKCKMCSAARPKARAAEATDPSDDAVDGIPMPAAKPREPAEKKEATADDKKPKKEEAGREAARNEARTRDAPAAADGTEAAPKRDETSSAVRQSTAEEKQKPVESEAPPVAPSEAVKELEERVRVLAEREAAARKDLDVIKKQAEADRKKRDDEDETKRAMEADNEQRKKDDEERRKKDVETRARELAAEMRREVQRELEAQYRSKEEQLRKDAERAHREAVAEKERAVSALQKEHEIDRENAKRAAEEELRKQHTDEVNRLKAEAEVLSRGLQETVDRIMDEKATAEDELQAKKTREHNLREEIQTVREELEKDAARDEAKEQRLTDLAGQLDTVVRDKIAQESSLEQLDGALRAERERREEREGEVERRTAELHQREEEIGKLRRELRDDTRKRKLLAAEARIREEAHRRKEREAQRKMQQALTRTHLEAQLKEVSAKAAKAKTPENATGIVSAAIRQKKQVEDQLQKAKNEAEAELAKFEVKIEEQVKRERELGALMEESAAAYQEASKTADKEWALERGDILSKLQQTQDLLDQERACAAFFAEQLEQAEQHARLVAEQERADAENLPQEEAAATQHFYDQLQRAEAEGAKWMRNELEDDLRNARSALEEEKQCAAFFASQVDEQRELADKAAALEQQLLEEKECAEFFAAEVTAERKKRRELEKLADALEQSNAAGDEERRVSLSIVKQRAENLEHQLNEAVAERLNEVQKRDQEIARLEQQLQTLQKARPPATVTVTVVSHEQAVAMQQQPQELQLQQQQPQQQPHQQQQQQQPPAAQAPKAAAKKQERGPLVMPALPKLPKAHTGVGAGPPEAEVFNGLPDVVPSAGATGAAPPPSHAAQQQPATVVDDRWDTDSDSEDDVFKTLSAVPREDYYSAPLTRVGRAATVPSKRRACPFPDSDSDGEASSAFDPTASSASTPGHRASQISSFKDRGGRGLFRCPYCDVGFPEELSSIDLPANCPVCGKLFLLLSSMIVMTVDDEVPAERPASKQEDTSARDRPSPTSRPSEENAALVQVQAGLKEVSRATGTYDKSLSYEERRRRILADHTRQEKLFVLGDYSLEDARARTAASSRRSAAAPPAEESYEERKKRILTGALQQSRSTVLDSRLEPEMKRVVRSSAMCPCGASANGKCILCNPVNAQLKLDAEYKAKVLGGPPPPQKCPCGSAPQGKCLFCDD